jgi:hypothetical protein
LDGEANSVTGRTVVEAPGEPRDDDAAGLREASDLPDAPTQEPPSFPSVEPTVAAVDAGGSQGRKQPARLGLNVRFESRPDDPQLGSLRDSTLWVNDAHPAYRRAAASRSEGYHIAVTLAMTLARLAVEPTDAHDFITTLLAAWGEVGTTGGR